MHTSFSIAYDNLDDFISHWSSKCSYPIEYLYDNDIRKHLTETSRMDLFE